MMLESDEARSQEPASPNSIPLPSPLSADELVAEALDAADCGFRVLPVYPPRFEPDGTVRCSFGDDDCDDAGKHPRIRWKLKATTDANMIRGWWRTWPDSNIAVVCGSEFIVLDLDARNGAQEGARELRASSQELPTTLTHTTGDGAHLFYRVPPAWAETKLRGREIATGIEARTGDKIVVWAGSLHRSGEHYRTETDGRSHRRCSRLAAGTHRAG
jgi:hypothetical protein